MKGLFALYNSLNPDLAAVVHLAERAYNGPQASLPVIFKQPELFFIIVWTSVDLSHITAYSGLKQADVEIQIMEHYQIIQIMEKFK